MIGKKPKEEQKEHEEQEETGGMGLIGAVAEIRAEEEKIQVKDKRPTHRGDKRIIYEEDESLVHVKSFQDKYERGKQGKNKSITMGFKRLSRYVGIRRQVYYLIGGFTGSGKTTVVDDAFVLNPIEWFLHDKHRDKDIDLKILYWSMERSKDYKVARWLSRTIFLAEQVIIPIDTIMGWSEIPTIEQQRLIDKHLPTVNEMLEKVVTIFEGPTNPTGVYKELQRFSRARGHEEEVIVIRKDGSEYEKKIYIPNNPNEIVLLIVDTINLTKPEKREDKTMMTPKEAIDKMSEYLRWGRDYLGYSPVPISQFNREISNPIRLKNGDVQPQLEDFAGTSSTQNDAEVVIALFDPMRYKVEDIYGYQLGKLKEGRDDKYPGSKKYRQLSILKNSYGADDVGVGLAYQPQVGLFKELPFAKDMTDDIYEQVINNDYFLLY